MKKNFYIFLILLIVYAVQSTAQAPNWVWAKDARGFSADAGSAVATDPQGNVVYAGMFETTVDFDPGPGVYNLTAPGTDEDAFVCKLDSGGNFIWARSFGGPGIDYARGVGLDSFGNVYVCGDFAGTADLDPTAAVFNVTAAGDRDAFIVKLSASGNFVWARTFGSAGTDQANAISVDPMGNVHTTGVFVGTVDFDPGASVFNLTANALSDIFVYKLNAAGNFVWAKAMGGQTHDYGQGIATDASGNVYTTGFFHNLVDFDPGPGVFNLSSVLSSSDCFVSKLDAAGNFIWARSVTSNSYGNAGWGIAVDALRNVYVTGSFNGTADFDPGPAVYPLTPNNSSGIQFDVFVFKLDMNGDFVWAKAMGGPLSDQGSALKLDAQANVYVCGTITATADMDPGSAVYNLITSGTSTGIFVCKLDQSGNFVWAAMADGPGNETGRALALDKLGRVYMTGSHASSAITIGATTLTNIAMPLTDVVIAKLDNCTAAPVLPTGITGSATPCAGSMQTYTAPLIPGITGYVWTLPPGWTGSSTTNTITAVAGSSGTITVTAVSGCGTSPAQSFTVNVLPAPPAVITAAGSLTFCAGDSVALQANLGAGLTYQWRLNGSPIAGATNSSYSVHNGGGYTVLVSLGQCSSLSLPMLVVVTPLPIPVITLSGYVLTAPAGFAAYQWYRNTLLIAGATNASYTATQPGNYHVLVTNANGCKGESNIINAAVGISELTNGSGIIIYPNPADGSLTLNGKLPAGDKEVTIEITDVTGKRVHTENINVPAGVVNQQVDISRWQPATYFVKLISATGSYVLKLMKQ